MRCCILEHKLQHLFDDRHGLETESAMKVDLVQTRRKKGRGSRNKVAVRNDTKCEQQELMHAFDEVCDTPRDMDMGMDHSFVGCDSAVLEPGEHGWTSHADMPDDLDGTCWSSTDKGCWRKDTRWHTPKRVNRKRNTFSWGKRPWWCYGWHYDYNSRALQAYNDKGWYDLGRVATEQWRSGRLGNLMEGIKGLRKLQLQPM